MTTALTAVSPRPVVCVIDHEYRDVAVADAVTAGRFTYAGITLDLGIEPDWLGASLPPDAQWRIEWTKFYYGLDLAHAYEVTGDGRYATGWERLVRSWVRQVPVGIDKAHVAARRVLNWLYAWQHFDAAAPGRVLARDGGTGVVTHMAAEVAYIRDHLTVGRNHRTLELYCLLLFALAFPTLDGDGALLAFAVAELHTNLLASFHSDGVHRESSTHYHAIALRSFVGALANARRFGISFPDGFAEVVRRACAFARHCTRPGGTIPALSDSDTGSYAELLALASEQLGEDVVAVRTTAADFRAGGYFVQRSGWDPSARFLIFDCGPLGDGGHGHYDALSVEIASGSDLIVADPGRYTYDESPPNFRRWFKGTAAHNTVTVDGLDQTPYRRGAPEGDVARARFLGRSTTRRLDVLAGEVESPAYDAVHTRRIAFVAGAWWVIDDKLRASSRHSYDLWWHLVPATGAVAVQPADRDGGPASVDTPLATFAIAGADALTIERGWMSPEYGIKHEAPVIRASTLGTVARFTTVVWPRSLGPLPPVRRTADGVVVGDQVVRC